MTGKGMPQRVKTILSNPPFASENRQRWFNADPPDNPQNIQINQIVADIFTVSIKPVVTFRSFGADIIITLPRLSKQKHFKQLIGDRDSYLFAGFELLDPNPPPFHIDTVPLQQYTIF